MNDIDKQRYESIKAIGLLPSPRGVALSILELTANARASIAELTRLVQMDPAMAGRILRYANATHGGALRHIVSLQHAITFLGLFRVRQIALGFSLIDQYRNGACPAFDYLAYWQSSLAAGIAAQQLAAQAKSPPEESFTCGLLAGIGRLALATLYPEEYADLLDSGASGTALLDEERAHFGLDHAQLSAAMLADWGLPEIFTSAVRHHEQPGEAPCTPDTRAYALTASLHLASRIGQLLVLDDAQRWQQIPSLFHAAAQLGLDAAEVPPLVGEVIVSWQEWSRELELPAKDKAELDSILASMSAGESSALRLGPLNVALVIADPERQRELAETLTAMELSVDCADNLAGLQVRLVHRLPDLILIDLGGLGAAAPALLRELRAAIGPLPHVIALLPLSEEGQLAQLLLAGASDYLTYDYSEAALIARLANAQQVVALRGAVQAERELAISSSGEWARSNRRLLHEALTDPLTQLPNRRNGLDRFAQEWAIAQSNALPIACMMLDIDHFKRVNDQRGHDIGDLVLQQIAAVVEGSCRRSDIVFRYGGEEFCCICPNTAVDDALQLAERIADNVRQGRYGMHGATFAITLSIGIAIGSPLTEDPAALIVQADKALYLAKEQGRDRVVALI